MFGTTKKEQQPAWQRRANGKQNKQLEAGSQDPDSISLTSSTAQGPHLLNQCKGSVCDQSWSREQGLRDYRREPIIGPLEPGQGSCVGCLRVSQGDLAEIQPLLVKPQLEAQPGVDSGAPQAPRLLKHLKTSADS